MKVVVVAQVKVRPLITRQGLSKCDMVNHPELPVHKQLSPVMKICNYSVILLLPKTILATAIKGSALCEVLPLLVGA